MILVLIWAVCGLVAGAAVFWCSEGVETDRRLQQAVLAVALGPIGLAAVVAAVAAGMAHYYATRSAAEDATPAPWLGYLCAVLALVSLMLWVVFR